MIEPASFGHFVVVVLLELVMRMRHDKSQSALSIDHVVPAWEPIDEVLPFSVNRSVVVRFDGVWWWRFGFFWQFSQ